MMKPSEKPKIDRIIRAAIKEDACRQDVTTLALVPKGMFSRAIIVAREPSIICGIELVKRTLHIFDKRIQLRSSFKDGDRIPTGGTVLTLSGNAQNILKAERIALNFLSHLSGIATMTRLFVDQVKPFKAKIMDTRKTTPGLRILERYAVRCGGGQNHRFDLQEMMLVKDNHRQTLNEGLFYSKLLSLKRGSIPLEIEVDTLAQLKKTLAVSPDIVLLDNMSLAQIKQAVTMIKKQKQSRKPLIEVSGGVNLNNVRSIARLNVDRISIGALTQSFKNINFSLEFK